MREEAAEEPQEGGLCLDGGFASLEGGLMDDGEVEEGVDPAWLG